MHYYADMTFFKDFNVLIGIGDGKIIFSHSYKTKKEKKNLIDLEKRYFPDLIEDKNQLREILNQLNQYENGKSINPSQYKTLFSRGTDFEKKVWKTLKKTKRGDVISYKELACSAGYPGAYRAVGTAMSKNYNLLFVPCHRVVKNNGELGNFSSGVENKKMLLKIEKK